MTFEKTYFIGQEVAYSGYLAGETEKGADRAKRDIEMNNRKVKVHQGDGAFEHSNWVDLKVGGNIVQR
ncbi:hypothetical protein GOBAR_DD30100 [Gossypium barbadense]|nr:hypothetical protein GOBAR_DD30100 [Gossypium barbadense]